MIFSAKLLHRINNFFFQQKIGVFSLLVPLGKLHSTYDKGYRILLSVLQILTDGS